MEAKITVAIADDHPQLRKKICELLVEMGFVIVVEAENGNDLLEKLETLNSLPDVCFLDYNMPSLKGDKLASILSKKYPGIKLAAMTANRNMDCMINMIGNGCDSFLIKSSSPTEWKTCIKELKEKGYFYSEWMKQNLLNFIKHNYTEIANIV